MGYKRIEWEAVHWIHLAQDSKEWRALMNTRMCVYLRVLPLSDKPSNY